MGTTYMLTLQLKTTCYGVFLPTMKTMMINNINNTNAWCQLVYKSIIFYYKNYKQLNQKLSKISLLYLIHCGTVGDSRDGWDSTFLFLVPVRARTSYSFLLDLLVHYLFFNSPFNALISLVSR